MAAWRSRAKRSEKIQRIGIIDNSPSWEPFRQQLRDLHYVEGQNLAYAYLRTDGRPVQCFKAGGLAWHGMLLVLAARCKLCGWAGQEHGGSIRRPIFAVIAPFQRYGRVPPA